VTAVSYAAIALATKETEVSRKKVAVWRGWFLD